MSAFQGSVAYSQNPPAGGAVPPFPANSAENGLSVDPITGRIVLGNDVGSVLATLLSDREIPMGGFQLRHTGMDLGASIVTWEAAAGLPLVAINEDQISGLHSNNNQFLLSNLGGFLFLTGNSVATPPRGGALILEDAAGVLEDYVVHNTNGQFIIDNAGGRQLANFDAATLTMLLGDLGVQQNGIKLTLDDTNIEASISSTVNTMLLLNNMGGTYQMGDLAGFVDGLKLVLDTGTETATIGTTAGRMLTLDQAGDLYRMGDVDDALNGNKLVIDDNGKQIAVDNSGGTILFLNMDPTSILASMGDVDSQLNGMFLTVDDFNQTTKVFASAGTVEMLSLDFANGDYIMGNQASNTFIHVDQGDDQIRLMGSDGISTTDPGGGDGKWKLGKITAGAVALDAANYVEVMIDSVLVKLLIAA